MSAVLPLPPAAEISDLVNAINQMYEDSPLPTTEVLVTSATYTVDLGEDPVFLILLVSTAFQKTIQIPADIPVNSRILVKDISGKAGTNMIIIEPLDGLLIDGSTATAQINVNWSSLFIVCAVEGLYLVGRNYVASQYFDSLILFDDSI